MKRLGRNHVPYRQFFDQHAFSAEFQNVIASLGQQLVPDSYASLSLPVRCGVM